MKKPKILILGAGLAGLTAAWHLQKKKRDCVLFEKEDQVGGLCRSKKIEGFTFDHDGHLLHFKNPFLQHWIKCLLKNNLTCQNRRASIYHSGIFMPYPFQAHLHSLPAVLQKECLLGFLNRPSNGYTAVHDFENWIKRSFGDGIARHFMIPYNRKFWTVAPAQLTTEWLNKFIPVPTNQQVIEGTFGPHLNGSLGYNARFWYPRKGGIDVLPRALAKSIKNIRTQCNITCIDLKNKEVTVNDSTKEKFDILISTAPLNEFSKLIPGIPAEVAKALNQLKWNSIFNLNLGVRTTKCPDEHWIYFHQPDISFFRVGFFSNISSNLAPKGSSSLYAEVAYSPDKPIDKTKTIQNIVRDLKKVGILTAGSDICVKDTNTIPYGYPIYDRNYHRARTTIINFLAGHNIQCCGRYGSWRYMSMEDTMMDAVEIARHLSRTRH